MRRMFKPAFVILALRPFSLLRGDKIYPER